MPPGNRPQRRKAATELREALGVRGACSRFRATPTLRQRQQAGRTPNASRGGLSVPAGRELQDHPHLVHQLELRIWDNRHEPAPDREGRRQLTTLAVTGFFLLHNLASDTDERVGELDVFAPIST